MSVRKGASAHADWRVIVTAYAPNGVPYDDLACAVGDYAASEIGNLGAAAGKRCTGGTAGWLDDAHARAWVDVCPGRLEVQRSLL